MLLSYSMKSSLQREPGKQPIYKLRKKKKKCTKDKEDLIEIQGHISTLVNKNCLAATFWSNSLIILRALSNTGKDAVKLVGIKHGGGMKPF